MVAADDRRAVSFSLTPGQWGDGPAGRALLRHLPQPQQELALIMDRAYEGDETRQLALDLGFTPVVPPKITRRNPWSLNEQLYRRRNEIERLFRRLKAYRRIFSRFDKLDVMFTAFIHFALITEALRPQLV
jgi:transposase